MIFLDSAPVQREVPQRLQQGVPLRAQIARNQRNRARIAVAEQPQSRVEQDSEDSDDNDDDSRRKLNASTEKMGAKKRAKLEAKADKKMQREADLEFREDKKKREALAEEEKKKFEEKEKVFIICMFECSILCLVSIEFKFTHYSKKN